MPHEREIVFKFLTFAYIFWLFNVSLVKMSHEQEIVRISREFNPNIEPIFIMSRKIPLKDIFKLSVSLSNCLL